LADNVGRNVGPCVMSLSYSRSLKVIRNDTLE